MISKNLIWLNFPSNSTCVYLIFKNTSLIYGIKCNYPQTSASASSQGECDKLPDRWRPLYRPMHLAECPGKHCSILYNYFVL